MMSSTVLRTMICKRLKSRPKLTSFTKISIFLSNLPSMKLLGYLREINLTDINCQQVSIANLVYTLNTPKALSISPLVLIRAQSRKFTQASLLWMSPIFNDKSVYYFLLTLVASIYYFVQMSRKENQNHLTAVMAVLLVKRFAYLDWGLSDSLAFYIQRYSKSWKEGL